MESWLGYPIFFVLYFCVIFSECGIFVLYFFVFYFPCYISLCCIFCVVFYALYFFMLYYSCCMFFVVLYKIKECYIKWVRVILLCIVITLSFFNFFFSSFLKIFLIYSIFSVLWCCIFHVVWKSNSTLIQKFNNPDTAFQMASMSPISWISPFSLGMRTTVCREHSTGNTIPIKHLIWSFGGGGGSNPIITFTLEVCGLIPYGVTTNPR